MTEIQKFKSDVQRTIKHERADNNGRFNSERAIQKIIALFIRTSSVPGNLSRAVAYYWKESCIDQSTEPQNEPTETNIQKLGAMLSFLEDADEDEEVLTQEDWTELSDLVNYEAEDLPIEILQSLMSKIVSKGVL